MSTQRQTLKARSSDICGLNAPSHPTSIISDRVQSSLDHKSRFFPEKLRYN